MLLVLTTSIMSAISIRFELIDPLILLDTDFKVERGVNEVNIEIAFISPCEVDDKSDWSTLYNIKSKAYNRLAELCNKDFQPVLDSLVDLEHCLPAPPVRPERVVPIVIGVVAIAAAVGGTGISAYRYWAPGSDYNRINLLEDQYKRLNQTLEQYQNELNEARQRRLETINEVAKLNKRIHENKEAIHEITKITPDLAYSASMLAIKLNNYREGIKIMQRQCNQRKLDMFGLSKIIEIKEFNTTMTEDTYIDSVSRSAPNAIMISTLISAQRAGVHIFEVYAINHYANYTSDPVYVTYRGPTYVIYDANNDCLKGIDKPKEKSIFETCEINGFRDPRIYKWEPIKPNVESITNNSRPIIIKMGRENLIYCLYHQITLHGRNVSCPPRPFRLPRSVAFNLTDIKYEVESRYFTRQSYDMSIKTPTIGNMSDPEYESQYETILNLKKAHENAVPVGMFGMYKGTLTIPITMENVIYGLTMVTGAITILRWCGLGRREAANGPTQSEHQEETHRETIKIYNGREDNKQEGIEQQKLVEALALQLLKNQLTMPPALPPRPPGRTTQQALMEKVQLHLEKPASS